MSNYDNEESYKTKKYKHKINSLINQHGSLLPLDDSILNELTKQGIIQQGGNINNIKFLRIEDDKQKYDIQLNCVANKEAVESLFKSIKYQISDPSGIVEKHMSVELSNDKCVDSEPKQITIEGKNIKLRLCVIITHYIENNAPKTHYMFYATEIDVTNKEYRKPLGNIKFLDENKNDITESVSEHMCPCRAPQNVSPGMMSRLKDLQTTISNAVGQLFHNVTSRRDTEQFSATSAAKTTAKAEEKKEIINPSIKIETPVAPVRAQQTGGYKKDTISSLNTQDFKDFPHLFSDKSFKNNRITESSDLVVNRSIKNFIGGSSISKIEKQKAVDDDWWGNSFI